MEGVAADGAPGPLASPAWEGPAADPLALVGSDFLASDLLALWQPHALADQPWSATWQRYLDGDEPGAAAALAAPGSRRWEPPSDLEAAEGLAPFQHPFWTRSARPAGDLRAEDALAAADCLYDFIHALERFDPEAAMACVAVDYHELTAGRALDRRGLRHWVEELLDGLRGRQIDVSLAEVPRPVRFGRLVLCAATIQVDAAAAPGEVPSSLVLRRLLAFAREARGSWRIAVCARLDDSGGRE